MVSYKASGFCLSTEKLWSPLETKQPINKLLEFSPSDDGDDCNDNNDDDVNPNI